MKKKNLKELRTKTIKELRESIIKAEEELVKLQVDKEAGKLKNVHQLTKKRNELAILKTILKEKELESENI